MDNSLKNVKELVINGNIYAKYEIQSDLLFIKVVAQLIPDNVSECEELYAHIILLIEQKKVKGLAYLNV